MVVTYLKAKGDIDIDLIPLRITSSSGNTFKIAVAYVPTSCVSAIVTLSAIGSAVQTANYLHTRSIISA